MTQYIPIWRRSRLYNPVSASVLIAALLSPLAAQSTDSTDDDDGEVFTLSPFEVTAGEVEGYRATSTLAGSRLNTSLRDISSPVSAITEQFLKDTGATDVQDLLIYTTNTEVAGPEGNFYGSSAGDNGYAIQQSLRPQSQTRVRGLFGADVTRDFWVTEVPLDSYNISGVEIQRGPNSILYGLGSPAGIINYTLKTPIMSENVYSVGGSIDSYGSIRGNFDLNQAIVPGKFAVRINGLAKEQKYKQDGKYEKVERLTVSPRWTPELAEGVFTQFTANFETGNLDANSPVLTPPLDYISNWYELMGKYSDPVEGEFLGVPDDISSYVTAFSGAGNGAWYDEQGLVFSDPNSTVVGGAGIADSIRQRGGNPFGTFQGVANFTENSMQANHILATKAYYQNNPDAMAIINSMEAASGREFGGFSGWQGAQILDTSVFNYWKDDVAGPNNTVWNSFKAYNFSAVQTYWEGRVGVELVLDKQEYKDGYERYLNDALRIGIDMNRYVRSERELAPGEDGGYTGAGELQAPALNPNFGRPFTFTDTTARTNEENRESIRGTAFYKFNLADFTNGENFFTNVFGEQTFTATASSQEHHHFNYDWEMYNIGEGFGPYSGQPLRGLHYLGSAVDPLSVNSAAGLGITGLNAVQQPPASITAQLLDERNPRTIPQFGTVNVDTLNASNARDRLLTGGSDFLSKTDTEAFIWQSRFLGDHVVGLFGWRKDDFSKQVKGTMLRSAPDARNNPGATEGRPNPFDPDWDYDPANELATSGQTRTYGLMVHSPESINKRLPWGSKISLGYNEASNINPSNVGFDIFRNQIPAQSGESKDYTMLISTLNDRLNLRATYYETSQRFANGSGPSAGLIQESLQRTLNGIMVETSYTGNTRINTNPEDVVNRWFFGGDGASSTFVPGSWNGADSASQAAMLQSPLQVRAAAATWGDPTTHTYANGTVIGQPDISSEELLYRAAWFDARSDAEWMRPLGEIGPDLFAAMDFRRNDNTDPSKSFEWASTAVPAFKNTTDISTRGLELEATANLSENWRLIVNASRSKAFYSNVLGESMTRYYEAMREVAKDGFTPDDIESGGTNWENGSDYWSRTGFAQIDEWGDEGSANNHQMFGEKWVANVETAYINAKASEGRSINELREWRFNAISTYQFTDGALDGFSVGGAIRYQDNSNLGFYPKWNNEAGVWVADLDKPIPGPEEYNYDAWVSYKRDLSDKVKMTVQLNLRNLFNGKELIPISANPDGTIGQYRLGATTSAELSTRFDF